MRIAHRLASLALVLGASACTTFLEVPVETPIKPKLDVAAFSRVLVAGFVAGGTEDVDANLETVRLLRTQLKNKSSLKVIDADVLPLMDAAAKIQGSGPAVAAGVEAGAAPADAALPKQIKEEKDLQAFEALFNNAAYWKKIGEEFGAPLIVTGTVMFTPQQRSGYVQKEQEVYDTFGRRRVVPVRTYMDRKGFILKPKFIFIDGRTGMPLYAETYREEVLYNAEQSNPALSSYFELMDRLMPAFLTTLSSQTIKGTRVLLK